MWLSYVLHSLLLGATATDPAELSADPQRVELTGQGTYQQVLITGTTAEKAAVDMTRTAVFRSLTPNTCTVNAAGIVSPVADGNGTIEAQVGDKKLQIAVVVQASNVRQPFNFERDIIPILSRYGCNASACHAKAEGQNGFKLSVFGFDPKADYLALKQESRGRRVHTQIPDQSLLLLKACGASPHGGGARIKQGSVEYQLLLDWIIAGMPLGSADDPQVKSITVSPRERQLTLGASQQLRVTAEYTDGRRVDVTALAKFQSNNEGLASVDDRGFVTAGKKPGDVAVMASFMGAVDTFLALVPQPQTGNKLEWPTPLNELDQLVDAKLKKLAIVPTGLCSDADFIRRVSIDIIGTLPTASESRAFLDDTRPNKRALLVEALLQRPEYADYWSLKWSDLLRVDRQALGHRGAYNYYRWIRESFLANKPFDQFAKELLLADGELGEAPAANFFKAVTKPGERASTISQVFLGVRIDCAQCHHHPFDRWGQDDYVGMEAFFLQPSIKKSQRGEMLVAVSNPGPSKHPRTGAPINAHPLGEPNPEEVFKGDRRVPFADWLTSPSNPWFARNIANRLWAHFLGRGLVTPIDDVRLTNPPSNPELLDKLAEEVVARKFNLRSVIQLITASRTYQAASQTNATNQTDEQNYSRALLRSMDAEVLFDAVCQTTGVPEKFDGLPVGYRAIQLWDSQVPHYFLRIFGRPIRATVCDCERVAEPSVAQVLHVMNSPVIQDKLAHEAGLMAKLAKSEMNDAQLVDELYLICFSRRPSREESQNGVEYLQKHNAQRRRAVEDLAWSLMNTTEFLFNH